MIRKILIAGAAAASALIAAAAPALAAPAISPACAGTAFCQGYELLTPDLALAVQGGTALSGTPLIVATASVDPAQDFRVVRQPGIAGLRIEFAPNGVRAGLCLSQPDTAVRTPIVLRRCHPDNLWQTWRRPGTGHDPYRMLVNRKSGLAIADPNSGGNGTPVRSRHPGFGDALNELWENAF